MGEGEGKDQVYRQHLNSAGGQLSPTSHSQDELRGQHHPLALPEGRLQCYLHLRLLRPADPHPMLLADGADRFKTVKEMRVHQPDG